MSVHPPRTDALIDAYVADVIKRLPGRLRNDVGFELRALLNDELRGRAADAGRLPDEAMTLELLRGFGQPDEVAARYHPPGVPIIPPQHSRGFALATFVGVALQWSVTLPMMAGSGLYNWVGAWWTGYGLGALWWPGFLVTMMMVAAWVRERWPAKAETWSPREVDPDHVNRPLFGLGLVMSLLGVAVWVALAWWTTVNAATSPVAQALQLDGMFIATRAPVVLLYWTLAIALLVIVTVEGRWRALTRRLSAGLNLACAAMLVWIALVGPVFAQANADATTRQILVVLAAVLLIQVGWKAMRARRTIRMPEALRSA